MKISNPSHEGNCARLKRRKVSSAVCWTVKPLLGDRGFTLLELIMVCLVLLILVTIAVPGFKKYQDTAKNSRAATEVRMLETAIVNYYNDRGFYPASLGDIGYGTLLDPWGHAYEYIPSGGHLHYVSEVNDDFDLWSDGADGTSSKSLAVDVDDIVRFNNGAYVGIAGGYYAP